MRHAGVDRVHTHVTANLIVAGYQLQEQVNWCDHLLQLHKKTIVGILHALAWICTCNRMDNTYFDILTQAQT